MARRTFDQWLEELKVIVTQNLETKLEDLPEFDKSDARAYFRDRSPPIVYYDECLSESVTDDTVSFDEMFKQLPTRT